MGRNKYIQNPDEVWQLFEAYKKEVKDNPRHIYDYVGKDGNQVIKPLERPLTIEGFKIFCHDNGVTIDHYIKNTDGRYEDYGPIITRVRDAIRHDQLEGGMVGQYNSNLTARINGLVDKKETEHKGSINIPNVPDIGNRT
jgi:hypothetical protein